MIKSNINVQILENIPIPGLHGSFSGRDIKASSKQRGVFLASYLNPANLLNVTPEIVDRLLNAYQRDLPRKVEYLWMKLSVGESGGLL
jgi:hypothetical protein